MAGYFSYFPKISYTFDRDTINQQAVTNILARSTFLKEVANNTSVYFKYQVKEEDTPEVIADKIYGDPYRAWIVLLFNNIINPNYDLPLKNDALESYIEKKYNQTTDQARSAVHHYEQTIIKTLSKSGTELSTHQETHIITQNGFNFFSNSSVPNVLPTVADTTITISNESIMLAGNITLTIVTQNRAISNYTYEFEQNEKKRTIRLLDPAYVQRVEQEFKQLMNS